MTTWQMGSMSLRFLDGKDRGVIDRLMTDPDVSQPGK